MAGHRERDGDGFLGYVNDAWIIHGIARVLLFGSVRRWRDSPSAMLGEYCGYWRTLEYWQSRYTATTVWPPLRYPPAIFVTCTPRHCTAIARWPQSDIRIQRASTAATPHRAISTPPREHDLISIHLTPTHSPQRTLRLQYPQHQHHFLSSNLSGRCVGRGQNGGQDTGADYVLFCRTSIYGVILIAGAPDLCIYLSPAVSFVFCLCVFFASERVVCVALRCVASRDCVCVLERWRGGKREERRAEFTGWIGGEASQPRRGRGKAERSGTLVCIMIRRSIPRGAGREYRKC